MVYVLQLQKKKPYSKSFSMPAHKMAFNVFSL